MSGKSRGRFWRLFFIRPQLGSLSSCLSCSTGKRNLEVYHFSEIFGRSQHSKGTDIPCDLSMILSTVESRSLGLIHRCESDLSIIFERQTFKSSLSALTSTLCAPSNADWISTIPKRLVMHSRTDEMAASFCRSVSNSALSLGLPLSSRASTTTWHFSTCDSRERKFASRSVGSRL